MKATIVFDFDGSCEGCPLCFAGESCSASSFPKWAEWRNSRDFMTQQRPDFCPLTLVPLDADIAIAVRDNFNSLLMDDEKNETGLPTSMDLQKRTPMRGSKVFIDAVNTFGIRSQLIKALEEFTELNMAILHRLDGRRNDENFIEEIIDAEIMLCQLKICYLAGREGNAPVDLDAINASYDAKVARLAAIVNKRREEAKPDTSATTPP
jgi:hypothetical protein